MSAFMYWALDLLLFLRNVSAWTLVIIIIALALAHLG